MYTREENINRIYAMILTSIVMGLLLLLCWFIIFRTPLPPYAEGGGGGIEVNFGNAENGFGNVQQDQLYPIETQASNIKTTSPTNDGEVLTQDDQTNPAVVNNNTKKKKKKQQQVTETQTQVKENNVVKITEPTVNPAAIYKKRPSSAGQGITKGSGDMGKPNGDPNSQNYTGDGGSGGGQGGGHGTGIGPGDGPGFGPGKGGGISFAMKDRKPVSLPKPKYNSAEQGKVVVAIIADKQGNIIRAEAGAQGTTTTNQQLWKEAENAAKKSKWTAKPDAPEEQKGTITYIFMRQGVTN